MRSLGTCVIAAGGNENYTATCSSFPNESGDASYRNNVGSIIADLRVRQPSLTYGRTVVLLSGGGSTGRFSALSNAEANVCTPLLAADCRVIELEWRDPSPLSNTGGGFSGTQGPLALMVRAATAFRGIYDNPTLHTQGLPFIICGQSGGSSEVAYVMAHYGAGDETIGYVDMAIMCSGPPHGRMDYGMMGAKKPSWSALVSTYRTNGSDTGGVAPATLFYDYSMGANATGTNGINPYVSQSADGGLLNMAYEDSVFNGLAAIHFPKTDIRALYGDGDSSGAASVGRVYTLALSGKSKSEQITTGNVQHIDVPGSTSGSAYLTSSILAATYNH